MDVRCGVGGWSQEARIRWVSKEAKLEWRVAGLTVDSTITSIGEGFNVAIPV